MALIAKQKYTQEKIDNLYVYLQLYKEKGNPIDYEILVDGFKAVRRTADPEMFYVFEKFVAPDSKAIEVLFYTGTSNNNDKHMFTFSDPLSDQSLNGLEIDARIKEGIEKEKRNIEFESCQKQNLELKEEVRELEQQIDSLEKEKQELLSSASPLKGILGEVGSTLIESFIRRNPRMLAKLPGGEALAGFIEKDNKENELESESFSHSQVEQPEVSFKAKQSLSQEDQFAIDFVGELKTNFVKSEFDTLLEILEHFASDKQSIELTLKSLKQSSHE
jgi:hypothetical protein